MKRLIEYEMIEYDEEYDTGLNVGVERSFRVATIAAGITIVLILIGIYFIWWY